MASKHTSPIPFLLTRTLRDADLALKTYGTCAVKRQIQMTTSLVQLNTQKKKRKQKNIQEQEYRIIKVQDSLIRTHAKHVSKRMRVTCVRATPSPPPMSNIDCLNEWRVCK